MVFSFIHSTQATQAICLQSQNLKFQGLQFYVGTVKSAIILPGKDLTRSYTDDC